MSKANKPDLLLRIACAITGADPELVAECEGVIERRRIIRHAVAFILAFTVNAVLWSAVLSLMLPRWAAVLAGLLIGAIVYLLDLSISTADWDLKGILAEPMPASVRSVKLTLARWLKLAIRLGISLMLATVTGTYVMLWMFNDRLETHLHEQRQTYNDPIEKEYRAAAQRLRKEIFGPHQADREAAVNERLELWQRVQKSQSELVDAERVATNARLEMHREETGLDGRAVGRGPKYHEAELLAKAADRRLSRAQQDLDRHRARLKEVESRITTIDARLSEADAHYQSRASTIYAQRDQKLRPEKIDFLMRYEALEDIKSQSLGLTLMSYATKAVIVIFEMIFFVVYLNDHASVYTFRLITRTRLDAQRAAATFNQALQQIEQGDPGGGNSNARAQDSLERPEPLVERCEIIDESLFDPPTDPSTTQAGQNDIANPASATQPPQRYPVIGGEPGQLVTTAQALADPDRYWVNPNRPDEIWDRHHRDQLLDPGLGDAA